MGSGQSTAGGPSWLATFLSTPHTWAWLHIDPIDALLANIMRLEVGDLLHDLVVDDAMDDIQDDLMDEDTAGSSSDEEDGPNMLEYEPEEELDQRDVELHDFIGQEMTRAARMFRLKLLVVCVLMCTNLGKDFSQDPNPSFSDLMGWTRPKKEVDPSPFYTSRIPRLFGTSEPMGDLSQYFPDLVCKPEYPVLFGYPPLVCYEVQQNSTTDPLYNGTASTGNSSFLKTYDEPISDYIPPDMKPFRHRRSHTKNSPRKRLIVVHVHATYRKNTTRHVKDEHLHL